MKYILSKYFRPALMNAPLPCTSDYLKLMESNLNATETIAKLERELESLKQTHAKELRMLKDDYEEKIILNKQKIWVYSPNFAITCSLIYVVLSLVCRLW